MFAHQVVERLNVSETLNFNIDMLFKEINSSFKFHFDDVYFFPKQTYEDFFKNIRLPYPILWLDYFNKGNVGGCSKGAFLCIENDTKIAIFSFHYYKNEWYLYPHKLTFNKNDNELFVYSLDSPEIPGGDVIYEGFPEVFGFLLLLNCKNITKEMVVAPEKLNKKRRRLNKLEFFNYYVLNVVVPSGGGRSSEKTEPLSHNRVHFCRGHFKEYTQENPLFGKLTGLYWWQPHVRGQSKKGIVLKDYNIKAGRGG